MSRALRQDRLATRPFKLIETPAHAQSSTKPHDLYVEAASIMALGHNMIIRGLNSIYLQAPYIKPEDYLDFINYSLCWVEVLDHHHKMEEESLFPAIEAKTGEVGIMEDNVEQHRAFTTHLLAFATYLKSSLTSPSSFSPSHLLTLIDTFSTSLLSHLASEIPTLLSISHFGPALSLLDMINAEAAKTPLYVSFTGGTPFFFRNLDVEFEGGLWRDWPKMPGMVWWVMQRSVCGWREGWWRFASCDRDGRLRELPFLGDCQE